MSPFAQSIPFFKDVYLPIFFSLVINLEYNLLLFCNKTNDESIEQSSITIISFFIPSSLILFILVSSLIIVFFFVVTWNNY